MNESRYPQTPCVETTSKKEVSISYHGLKISLSPVPHSPNLYVVKGLSKLEETVGGKVKETDIPPKIRNLIDPIFRKRNFHYEESRKNFLTVIKQYAEWFDEPHLEQLDRALVKYLTAKGQEQPKQYIPNGSHPNEALLKEQSRRFCNGWRMILRDNITNPATIDRLLGD